LAVEFFQDTVFGAEEDLRIGVVDRVVVDVGAIDERDAGGTLGDGFGVAAENLAGWDIVSPPSIDGARSG